MQVKIYQDKGMIRSIETAIENNPFREELDILLQTIQGYDYFYWGGLVRNGVLNHLHGVRLESNDIDIILDASLRGHKEKRKVDFKDMLKDFKNIKTNRYGLPKWVPKEGVEFDVSAFSECNKARVYGDVPLNIGTIIEGSDLTTSAIAYDPKEKKIYSYGAVESYHNNIIDLNFPEGNDVCAQLPRLVLHSKRFGFDIGEFSIDYIREIFDNSPDMKNDILNKMVYWGVEREFFEVISILKEISGKPNVDSLTSCYR